MLWNFTQGRTFFRKATLKETDQKDACINTFFENVKTFLFSNESEKSYKNTTPNSVIASSEDIRLQPMRW